MFFSSVLMFLIEKSLINRVDGDFRAASSPTDSGGGTWDNIGGWTGSAENVLQKQYHLLETWQNYLPPIFSFCTAKQLRVYDLPWMGH